LYSIFVFIPVLFIVGIMIFSLWLSYTEFGSPWNLIMTLIVGGFVIYVIKSKSFREEFLMKNLFKKPKNKFKEIPNKS